MKGMMEEGPSRELNARQLFIDMVNSPVNDLGGVIDSLVGKYMAIQPKYVVRLKQRSYKV